jgi:hypothetical protein
MNDRAWYAVDALMADLTIRHHHVRAASEEEAERKIRERYPRAVTILGRRAESWRQGLSRPDPVLRSARHTLGGRGSDLREP